MSLMMLFHILAVVAVAINPCTAHMQLTSNVKAKDLLRHRHTRQAGGGPRMLGCVNMISSSGEYWFQSSGSDDVCGLYVIGNVDEIVVFEITDFDISCEDRGLMALVDGWELESQLFPSSEDLNPGFQSPYSVFCGADRPPRIFNASQNVALIQFRVPQNGTGFRVQVRFEPNPHPCNVITPYDIEMVTLSNFGNRRNCTAEILFPVNLKFINIDIKTTLRIPLPQGREMEGLTVPRRCVDSTGEDYAALMYGMGVDTSSYGIISAFCGRSQNESTRVTTLGCYNSAIRLVSSGQYVNSLTVKITLPVPEEEETFRFEHPDCLL